MKKTGNADGGPEPMDRTTRDPENATLHRRYKPAPPGISMRPLPQEVLNPKPSKALPPAETMYVPPVKPSAEDVVVDIDQNDKAGNKELYEPRIIAGIVENFFMDELVLPAVVDYLPRHPEITQDDRSFLNAVLFEIDRYKPFSMETYMLTVNLIDTYMSLTQNVQRL